MIFSHSLVRQKLSMQFSIVLNLGAILSSHLDYIINIFSNGHHLDNYP
ncbi:hypothetical protein C789_3424 [Microcystis aeruginosa FACHB-905 = DIANCHI905]|uniref:Uncharacterized protein n=1 Tax=Microcystis aeruginosa PCC 7806SL TaxID=1903187 RepID=A0AB33BL56_MICA7|nr:hypothetical protein BH695_1866 [Microcystis aeruginosa PCC 7806SL]ELS46749.1 hypothetical protein C789_3424 [Microcystis aeruginosa FACHB-905 = DIANCHI905]